MGEIRDNTSRLPLLAVDKDKQVVSEPMNPGMQTVLHIKIPARE